MEFNLEKEVMELEEKTRTDLSFDYEKAREVFRNRVLEFEKNEETKIYILNLLDALSKKSKEFNDESNSTGIL